METPEITFDDFLKVDLRVGTITKVEEVPKSKKLVKLEVYFGELGHRTILAGIKEDFKGDLTGTQAIFCVNLAPRQMMGMESHGMILASRNADGYLSLASAPGAKDGDRLG